MDWLEWSSDEIKNIHQNTVEARIRMRTTSNTNVMQTQPTARIREDFRVTRHAAKAKRSSIFLGDRVIFQDSFVEEWVPLAHKILIVGSILSHRYLTSVSNKLICVPFNHSSSLIVRLTQSSFLSVWFLRSTSSVPHLSYLLRNRLQSRLQRSYIIFFCHITSSLFSQLVSSHLVDRLQ